VVWAAVVVDPPHVPSVAVTVRDATDPTNVDAVTVTVTVAEPLPLAGIDVGDGVHDQPDGGALVVIAKVVGLVKPAQVTV